MNSPRDFYAEDGKPIIPVLNRFARFVMRDATISISGGARVMKSAKGRRVVYEPVPQTFPGSFRVSLPGGLKIGVSEGLVSGLVPYMDGRRLDGMTEDGVADPDGKPTLSAEAPAESDRSYVLLLARVTADGEIGEDETTTDPVAEIVHREALPAGMVEAGRVARLLAVLSWQDDRIRSVRQVTWYDQEVVAVSGKARFRAAS